MQTTFPTINLAINYTDEVVMRDPDKIESLAKVIPSSPELQVMLNYMIAQDLESLANLQMDALNPATYQFNVYYLKAKMAALSEIQQLLTK